MGHAHEDPAEASVPERTAKQVAKDVSKAVGWGVLVMCCYFAVNLAVLAAAGPKPEPVSATLVANSVTCLLVLVVVVVSIRWKKTTPMRLPGPDPLQPMRPVHLLMLVAALGFTWVVGQSTAVWLQAIGLGSDFGKQQGAIGAANPLLVLLALLVSAPLTEELLIRGLLYPRLRSAMGYLPAAVLSALVFAALHGTVVHLGYTLTLGVLLAVAYELTRRIWVPVLMHLLFNLGALVPAAAIEPLATKNLVMIGNVALVLVLANLYDVVREGPNLHRSKR